MSAHKAQQYGIKDASYRAAGGETGIRKLVDEFFDRMGSDARFKTIYDMHPDDKMESRDKLARFLCGWLGGPKLYQQKYGSISIPGVHEHLAIATPERDQWLTCMRETVEEQSFGVEFKEYLMQQLFVPAEGVRKRIAKLREHGE